MPRHSKRGDAATLEHFEKYTTITKDDLVIPRREIDKAYETASS